MEPDEHHRCRRLATTTGLLRRTPLPEPGARARRRCRSVARPSGSVPGGDDLQARGRRHGRTNGRVRSLRSTARAPSSPGLRPCGERRSLGARHPCSPRRCVRRRYPRGRGDGPGRRAAAGAERVPDELLESHAANATRGRGGPCGRGRARALPDRLAGARLPAAADGDDAGHPRSRSARAPPSRRLADQCRTRRASDRGGSAHRAGVRTPRRRAPRCLRRGATAEGSPLLHRSAHRRDPARRRADARRRGGGAPPGRGRPHTAPVTPPWRRRSAAVCQVRNRPAT